MHFHAETQLGLIECSLYIHPVSPICLGRMAILYVIIGTIVKCMANDWQEKYYICLKCFNFMFEKFKFGFGIGTK